MIFQKILVIASLCSVMNIGSAECKNIPDSVNYAFNLPNEIVKALVNGDAKAVGKHFNLSVELIFSENQGVYGKSQAELILRNFFNNNASPTGKFNYKHLHGSERDNAQYYIGELHTGKGLYRVTLYMKDQLIYRVRIESND